MMNFPDFLDHVMENFAASYPYGLNKTEVTKLTFQAWCVSEANRMNPSPTVTGLDKELVTAEG